MKESIRKEIERRTPKGWYGLATPSGWDDLVEELFKKVLNIFPDLEIYQIKEKFGGLRFYTNVPYDHEAQSFIRKAEEHSFNVCEACGSENNVTTATGTNSYWVRSLCSECRV